MVSELIKVKITKQILKIKAKKQRVPALTIIQIGNNKDSTTYIKNKKNCL